MSDAVRIEAAGASAEEVAAITAAITAIVASSAAPSAAISPETERLDAWVRASRLGARNAGMARGSWRLSGRLDRRQR
ncbi:MAG: hypothetical protein JWL73_3490 [Actinomycetia bacterium]|nr:hypothetical protein [Actinomycetes bacterium]